MSLYTNPTQQHEPASVTVNFGEHGFAFAPPQEEGCPPPLAACEMSGPKPGAEGAAVAAGQSQQPASAAGQEQQQASGKQQQAEQQQREQQLLGGVQVAGGEAALPSDAPAAAAVQA